ncbi:MAG: CarD family transcriptional regulator [Sandaracinaceae bacterium]
MEFNVGDKAVHPHHGVGDVTAIEEKEIAGRKVAFYVLNIADSGTKVMVAKDAAERVGLRGVVSRRDAKLVLEELRSRTIAVTSQPWNRRHREYMEMLHSGSLLEVAKVYRDLSLIRHDKDLSFGERELLEKAQTRLVTEIAVSRRCKEERVGNEIAQILAN